MTRKLQGTDVETMWKRCGNNEEIDFDFINFGANVISCLFFTTLSGKL